MKRYLNSPMGSSGLGSAEALLLNQTLVRKMAAGTWSFDDLLHAVAEDDLSCATWLLDSGSRSRGMASALQNVDDGHSEFAPNLRQTPRADHGTINVRF